MPQLMLGSCQPRVAPFAHRRTAASQLPPPPATGRYRTARPQIACRATDDQQQAPEPTVSAPSATPAPPASAPESKPLILQEGQGTAIITGAISIIFGVAYFVLVFFMDSRGGQMLPPPPEAFGP